MKNISFLTSGSSYCRELANSLSNFLFRTARFVDRNVPGAGFLKTDCIPGLKELQERFQISHDHTVILRLGHTGSYAFWDSVAQLTPTQNQLEIDWKPADVNHKIKYLENLTEEKKEDIRLIGLHAAYPIHQCFSKRTRYVTLMRDPIKAALSTYFWQYNNRYNSFADWVSPEIKDGMSLREWVEISPDNIFTRWILKLEGKELQDSQSLEDTIKQCTDIIKDRFLMVGATEMFDESLFVYSLLSGEKKIPLWRHRGTSNAPQIEDLNIETINRIKLKTEIDAHVYKICKTGFEERYQKEINFFSTHIKSLKSDLSEQVCKQHFF